MSSHAPRGSCFLEPLEGRTAPPPSPLPSFGPCLQRGHSPRPPISSHFTPSPVPPPVSCPGKGARAARWAVTPGLAPASCQGWGHIGKQGVFGKMPRRARVEVGLAERELGTRQSPPNRQCCVCVLGCWEAGPGKL